MYVGVCVGMGGCGRQGIQETVFGRSGIAGFRSGAVLLHMFHIATHIPVKNSDVEATSHQHCTHSSNRMSSGQQLNIPL